MTPLEFLAAVLPFPGFGFYCSAGFTPTSKRHKFDDVLDNILNPIKKWVGEERDCYFALSTFEKHGSRLAENAAYIRCLFIDMDGYATKKEAAAALQSFLFKTGLDLLGTPYFVASGGGIHVYWPFLFNVTIAEWKPIAEKFKRLCVQEGMSIDMSVTADASRVLRLPETFNFKAKYGKPRPVKLLSEGDTFDFDILAAHITSQLKTPVPALPSTVPVLNLPGTRPTSVTLTPTSVKLFENSVTKFKLILTKTKEGSGCGQIKHYIENAEEDGMEPLWRGMLSIAQKCEEAPKAVVWLSNLHPYDPDRMQQKLDQIKGPYSCVSLDSINPGICETCPHWGKITNPLALGRATATVVEALEITVPDSTGEVKKLMRPEAPRGFAYGKNGGVYIEKEDIDNQGQITKKQVMLLPYDFFPTDILNNNGDHSIHMFAKRPAGISEVLLPQRAVASKDDTIKYLMNQNIVASFGAGNDPNLYAYVRACVEKLSTERTPINVPQSYGWQEDGSFVFASAVYRKGVKPISVPMPGLANVVNSTIPKGSIDAWLKVVQLLIRRKLWDQLTIMLLGTGAPLMRFTGLHGLTIHCTSTASGTGKSLALDTAASIWGHPTHYRTGSGTSSVAMQQRLGLLRSLPMITDEITSINRKDFEWFPAFLFSMSEGRGKERMESGSNKERENLSTWASMSLMSSNHLAVDYMTGVRSHSSDGELRRLIEYPMNEVLQWDAEEIELIKSLADNYGKVGEILAQYFVDNEEYLSTLVPETVRQMYKQYNAPNDERFWMAGAGVAVTAGILLNSQHTNIIDIPMGEIIKSLGQRIDSMRISIKSGKRTAEDILNSYVQEYQGKLVVVKYGDKVGPLSHFNDGTLVGKNTAKAEVMGRVEHGVTHGYIDFFIEERMLKKYCATMSFGYSLLKKDLEAQFSVSYVPKKDMLAKTDSPPMRVAAMKISRKITEDDEALISTPSLGAP